MARRLIPPSELPSYGITVGPKQRERLEAIGEFPRRVPITERTYGYVESEILDYIERRIEERDTAKPKAKQLVAATAGAA